jgi:hypothetical protein
MGSIVSELIQAIEESRIVICVSVVIRVESKEMESKEIDDFHP